jgi:trimeric autotransporter adhesin
VAVAGPTNARTSSYLVTFSEPVSGVDVADFGLFGTGSAAGRVSGVTQVDGSTYSVTLSGVKGSGSLRLDLNTTGTGITDQVGNALIGGSSSDAFALADVPPVIVTPRPSTVELTNINANDSVASRPLASPAAPAAIDSLSTLQYHAARSLFENLRGQMSLATLVSTPVPSEVDMDQGGSFDLSLPAWSSMGLSSWSVLELRTADGAPVPEWLHFDPISGSLQGTAPKDFQDTLRLEIIVTDSAGVHSAGVVQLHFHDTGHRPAPLPAPQPHADDIPARPDLDTQFSRHARTSPISTDAARALRQLHTRSARSVATVLPLAAASAAKSQGSLA